MQEIVVACQSYLLEIIAKKENNKAKRRNLIILSNAQTLLLNY